MKCVHGVSLHESCERCEIVSHVDGYTLEQHLDDMVEFEGGYWDIPSCPHCHGTLDEDGLHWASESDVCPAQQDKIDARAREFYRNQQLEQVED